MGVQHPEEKVKLKEWVKTLLIFRLIIIKSKDLTLSNKIKVKWLFSNNKPNSKLPLEPRVLLLRKASMSSKRRLKSK